MKIKDFKKGMKVKLVCHPDGNHIKNYGYRDKKLGSIFTIIKEKSSNHWVLEDKDDVYYCGDGWSHAWEPIDSCLKDLLK